MSDSIRDVHAGRVRQIAQEYEGRGYKIIVEPTPDQLPDFLRQGVAPGYQPDLIVESLNDSAVVEIKLRGKVRQEEWAEVARLIEQQPGWRFELVLGAGGRGVEDLDERTPLQPIEIETLLQTGQELAAQGRSSAALLTTWAATEAALRLVSLREEVKVPLQAPPMHLISALYSDGLLEREEYDALRQVIQQRNAAAHGFKVEGLDLAILTELQSITNRLLQEQIPQAA